MGTSPPGPIVGLLTSLFILAACGHEDASSQERAAQQRAAARSEAAPRHIEEIIRASWGSGAGQLGHTRPQEASAEGPMSFTVDRESRVFVLDQVNQRVVVFARGEAARDVALPADTYQDIAVDAQGSLWLLDRLARRSLLFMTAQGEVRSKVALEGPGVPDGGMVTAMFARPDGVWVEVGHTNLVRVALADGSPDPERTVAPGRFGAGGKLLRAALAGSAGAVVARVARGARPATVARVALSADVMQLCALEVDEATGRIFVGAKLFQAEVAPPFQARGLGDEVVILSAQGVEEGRVLFPPEEGPEEQFRQVRVGDDGALYHLGLSAEGVTVRRFVP